MSFFMQMSHSRFNQYLPSLFMLIILSLMTFFTFGCTDRAVEKGQECPEPPSSCAQGLTCDSIMNVCQVKCHLSQQCDEGLICDGNVCYAPYERRTYQLTWYIISGSLGLIAFFSLLFMLSALIRSKGSDKVVVNLIILSLSLSVGYWAYPMLPQKYKSKVESPRELSSMISSQIQRGEERVLELSAREQRLYDQLLKLVEIKQKLLGSQDQVALERTQKLITKVKDHLTRVEKTAHQLRDQLDTLKVQASVTIEGEDKGDERLIEMLKTADEVLVEFSE